MGAIESGVSLCLVCWTTSMSMQFLAPARAIDLIAIGRVLRRGKTLVNCDVDVVTPEGEAVAKAIATYKVG
uniref:PaaI family thioesterase n=1 Tax=Mycobacterium sp. OAE908 TaxID=2817899 RepID=UPI0034E230BB